MHREHAGGGGVVEDSGDALPSRAAAIESTRAALDGEPGPVLLTGEAGAGKTWLVDRLAADRADARRWLAVDLAPTTDPADFYMALGHGLGLDAAEGGRRPLGDFLAEQAVEGRRWVLVVDEAHNASADVLEELRLLSNRLGRADGFAGMILVAQTRLARRLGTAPLAALAARVAARVHLRPIDADEAAELLAGLREGRPRSRAEVDDLHRQAGGNPRRLLRLANAGAPRRASARVPAARPLLEPTATAIEPPSPPPRLGADRPPLRVEEGLIEVGWDGPDPELEEAPAVIPRAMLLPAGEGVEESEVEEFEEESGEDEPVRDHYAALQAWDEWARNQGRQPALAGVSAPPVVPVGDSEDDGPPLVQTHPSQDFAPYSQLFSRLKRAAADTEG